MYLLFGAGKIGKQYIDFLHSKNIWDFVVVDSDIRKIGTEISGQKIIALHDAPMERISLAVITTEDRYYNEIYGILKELNKELSVVSYIDTVVIADSDVIDTGGLRLKEDIDPGIYSFNQMKGFLDENSFNDLDRFFYDDEHRLIHKFIHYSEAYDRFFNRFRNRKIKVLEIGVFKGGSLQMWKKYFGKDAKIYGVDIDENCRNYCEDNVEVLIGDQANEVFLDELKERIGYVDIIIDDGGHTMEQQRKCFETLFEIVKDGGIYLCEDTHTSYWKEYGGGYKGEQTFIEYAKNIVDLLHEQYFDSCELNKRYCGVIRSLSFFDSMVFIEKKVYSNRSIPLKQGNIV